MKKRLKERRRRRKKRSKMEEIQTRNDGAGKEIGKVRDREQNEIRKGTRWGTGRDGAGKIWRGGGRCRK